MSFTKIPVLLGPRVAFASEEVIKAATSGAVKGFLGIGQPVLHPIHSLLDAWILCLSTRAHIGTPIGRTSCQGQVLPQFCQQLGDAVPNRKVVVLRSFAGGQIGHPVLHLRPARVADRSPAHVLRVAVVRGQPIAVEGHVSEQRWRWGVLPKILPTAGGRRTDPEGGGTEVNCCGGKPIGPRGMCLCHSGMPLRVRSLSGRRGCVECPAHRRGEFCGSRADVCANSGPSSGKESLSDSVSSPMGVVARCGLRSACEGDLF